MQNQIPKESTRAVVETKGLTKIYGGDGVTTQALNGVDLTINRGEFVAIVGPSGSGKSTLLNMLGALDTPTSGNVFIDGIDITSLNGARQAELRNKKIGFVFQSFNLIPRMNAMKNVMLPLSIRGVPLRERRSRALKMLDLVGLRNKVDHRPSEMSGGEQQRVAVARALVTRPPIILGDEPTGNLDTKNTASLVELLKKLNKYGMTIIIVTHNLEIANQTDRIVTMRDGRIERDRKVL